MEQKILSSIEKNISRENTLNKMSRENSKKRDSSNLGSEYYDREELTSELSSSVQSME
jgi:hypothetical protein